MAVKKSKHRDAPIPKRKLDSVKELVELIKKNNTLLIASIKNLPGSQFQQIKKKLRGKAIVKVPKKNLVIRAIDSSGEKEIEILKEEIHGDVAILFSNLDAYDLAGELIRSQSPMKAKPGQIAPEDIEVQEGPTELVPGPAISELGALGIQIEIKEGKINIKKSKVIAKKGTEISQGASDLMSKLNMQPFKAGYIPLIAFDNKEKKVYREIKINSDEAVEKLKHAFGRAMPFAVSVGYSTPETITFLLSKANAHGNAIKNLSGREIVEEKVESDDTQSEKTDEGDK